MSKHERTTKSGLAIDLTEVTLVGQEAGRGSCRCENERNRTQKLSGLRTRMGFSSKGES
jgi:hypothetical protein